jgi:hypothetical protein
MLYGLKGRLMRTLLLLLAVALAVPASAQPPVADPEPGPVWPKLSDAQHAEVMKFGEDFKQFMAKAKSEMTFVREAAAFAEARRPYLLYR